MTDGPGSVFRNVEEDQDNNLLVQQFFNPARGDSLKGPFLEWQYNNITSSTISDARTLDIVVASSEDQADTLQLIDHIDVIFDRAKYENFEDGLENDFSQNIETVIYEFGNLALTTVTHIIRNGQTTNAIICETLRTLGNINHPDTHRNRLQLLGYCLVNDSAYIRDAASLGIASMDDPSSIPQITSAIEDEQNIELKADLELVLEQLLNTQQCHSS